MVWDVHIRCEWNEQPELPFPSSQQLCAARPPVPWCSWPSRSWSDPRCLDPRWLRRTRRTWKQVADFNQSILKKLKFISHFNVVLMTEHRWRRIPIFNRNHRKKCVLYCMCVITYITVILPLFGRRNVLVQAYARFNLNRTIDSLTDTHTTDLASIFTQIVNRVYYT